MPAPPQRHRLAALRHAQERAAGRSVRVGVATCRHRGAPQPADSCVTVHNPAGSAPSSPAQKAAAAAMEIRGARRQRRVPAASSRGVRTRQAAGISSGSHSGPRREVGRRQVRTGWPEPCTLRASAPQQPFLDGRTSTAVLAVLAGELGGDRGLGPAGTAFCAGAREAYVTLTQKKIKRTHHPFKGRMSLPDHAAR